MRRIFATLVGCLAICFSNALLAWNKGGHQTTGSIAYRELAESRPDVITAVQSIMKSHPMTATFEKMASADVKDDGARERLFMAMAIWPDEIRPPSGFAKQYHHDSWHWINVVYTPADSTFQKPDEIVKERIFEAFAKNVAVVSDAKATDAEKAIALCWIFHLVGDLHQPLHTTALFNEEFPNGDKGGNSTMIRVKEDGKVINLHSFWDGAVLGSSDPKAAMNLATKLRTTYPKASLAAFEQRPYLGPETFESWGRQESSPLAVNVAYANGELLKYARADDAYQLTVEYVTKAKETADSQVVLAGYRLAAVLDALLAKR